jgi:branched-chain amino acid transport system substrate-binding protein
MRQQQETREEHMRSWKNLAAGALMALAAASAQAQAQEPFKIGLILPMTGPFQSTGIQANDAAKLFLKDFGDTVAGRKIEIILRDDASSPANTRRIAQELVVQDHIGAMVGFGITPQALAVAPISAEAKVPMLLVGSAASISTEKSPYAVRVGQTVPQSASVMATWAAKNGMKTAVTIVSDYAPGYDAEEYFAKAFTAGGGQVVEKIRVPVVNPDFAPFLDRAKNDKPSTIFIFLPAGQGAAFAKQYIERGLQSSGIKLIATHDVMDDDVLDQMGDVVLGMISAGPYSAAHDSPMNKKFVADFEALNGGKRPNFMGLFTYDSLRVIYKALEATKGNGDGPALVDAMKGMKFESARGPVEIDPVTRDVIQNIYIRKNEKIDGHIFAVETETVPMVRDPGKP